MHQIITFLNKQAEAVRRVETEADRVLLQENDSERYRSLLLEKVELLAGLPEKVLPYAEDLDPTVRQEVKTVLQGFGQRAEQALDLNSVFFMRQLLYPEDYQEGGANNLEAFIATLEP